MPLVSAFLYYQILPVCGGNMRLIGNALTLYHQDHSTFPPSLHALVEGGYVNLHSLHCPLALPEREGEPDYVYVLGLTVDDPGDWIVAYDHPANHERRDGHVLYVSGEVKNLRLREFVAEIKRFRQEYEQARGEPPTVVGPRWP